MVVIMEAIKVRLHLTRVLRSNGARHLPQEALLLTNVNKDMRPNKATRENSLELLVTNLSNGKRPN